MTACSFYALFLTLFRGWCRCTKNLHLEVQWQKSSADLLTPRWSIAPR